MKKTGSDMPPSADTPGGSELSGEIIERAQLQAEVAQQRVRLAKEELRRARKRLKEAKREAKRTRKHAALARKAWKRARRKAKRQVNTRGQSSNGLSVTQRRNLSVERAAARSRRAPNRQSSSKRGGKRTKARRG